MGVSKALAELLKENLKTFRVPEDYVDLHTKLTSIGPNRARSGKEIAENQRSLDDIEILGKKI